MPQALVALDIFIGEESFLSHGIGSHAIGKILVQCADRYTHAFVDPAAANSAAIRAYEKIGFQRISSSNDAVVWMTKCLRW